MTSSTDKPVDAWQRTQWSALTPGIGAVVIGIVFATIPGAVAWGLAVLVAVAISQFCFARVRVDARALSMRFGLGLIRFQFPLDRIAGFRAVRNRWYWGLGIRFIPNGRLLNVSGLDAVELVQDSGRRVRIGTDRPRELVAALERRTGMAEVQDDAALPHAPASARRTYVSLLSLVGLLVVLLPLSLALQGREPTLEIDARSLRVSSFLYSAEVPLVDATEVALVETLPRIRVRENGYALGGTLRGHFRVDGLGGVWLFVEAGKPPFVYVAGGAQPLFFGFEDAGQTRAAFERLESARRAAEP